MTERDDTTLTMRSSISSAFIIFQTTENMLCVPLDDKNKEYEFEQI